MPSEIKERGSETAGDHSFFAVFEASRTFRKRLPRRFLKRILGPAFVTCLICLTAAGLSEAGNIHPRMRGYPVASAYATEPPHPKLVAQVAEERGKPANLMATENSTASPKPAATATNAAAPSIPPADSDKPVRAPISAAELADLSMLGAVAFAKGDVVAARRYYQIAAGAGDGKAALLLGETFDKAFLDIYRLNVPADDARAVFWYRKARDLGAEGADALLKQLEASVTRPADPLSPNDGSRPATMTDGAEPVTTRGHPVATPTPSGVSAAVTNPSDYSPRDVPNEPLTKTEIRGPMLEVVPRGRAAAVVDETVSPIATLAPRTTHSSALSGGELSVFLTRGDTLFGVGDVVTARLFYERGAAAGDSVAALRLGETFDPTFLARARFGFVKGDSVKAAEWYSRARDLGNADAAALLKSAETANK